LIGSSTGLQTDNARNKRLVRRWLREAREHRPVIDRVTYPETVLIAEFRGAVEYRQCQQSIREKPRSNYDISKIFVVSIIFQYLD
jgi:hypothetical protein